MSENDSFDAVINEMLRLAESLLGGAMNPMPAPQEIEETAPDELIERKDGFTYVLNAPGYEKDQLLVSVLEDEVDVKGPDFAVSKHLPNRVDPETVQSKYVNGILSVTVRKRQ
ncbi:MAG: Hsp20/alpha crystallin family protein [Nitrososphaerales archaeon]|nr:Hsp20/alpha crystallin family protein [Nitrososphaerales archaeon]